MIRWNLVVLGDSIHRNLHGAAVDLSQGRIKVENWFPFHLTRLGVLQKDRLFVAVEIAGEVLEGEVRFIWQRYSSRKCSVAFPKGQVGFVPSAAESE